MFNIFYNLNNQVSLMDSPLPKMGPSDFEMIRHLKVGWGVQLFENIWTDYPVAEPSQFAWSSAIGFANLPNRLLQMCPLAQFTKCWPPNGLEGSWITVKMLPRKRFGPFAITFNLFQWTGWVFRCRARVTCTALQPRSWSQNCQVSWYNKSGHTWSWKQDQSSPSLLAHLYLQKWLLKGQKLEPFLRGTWHDMFPKKMV